MSWIKTSDRLPPPCLTVLAYVPDAGKGGRRVRACYVPEKWIEAVEPDVPAEWHDPETDTYYLPEGWYEDPVYAEEQPMIPDAVTHWCPMPEPPEGV